MKPRVLIIDDEVGPPRYISKALKAIGVDPDITVVAPDPERLGQHMMGMCGLDTTSLDEYDLALVDLELEGAHRKPQLPISYYPDDLRGGSEVLPHLRLQAPWLPVIGYSRLFDLEIPSFLSVSGGFGFDGMIQRTIFQDAKITNELWLLCVENARKSRKRSLLGEEFLKASASPEIRFNDSVARALTSISKGWQFVIEQLFHFAQSVSLQLLTPGFSGAVVLKATVNTRLEAGSASGVWVVKIGGNRSRLWAECHAHLKYVRGGLPLARSAPLLWNGVVCEDGIGAIAYQAVENVEDGLEFLGGHTSADLLARVGVVLRELHSGAGVDSFPLGKIMESTVTSARRVVLAAQANPDWELGRQWMLMTNGHAAPRFDRTVIFTAGMIHRDANLRNFLLGTRDVIIDFALAKAGPVVYDIARVVCDIIIYCEAELNSVRTLAADDQCVSNLLSQLGIANFKEDDKSVFDVSLQLAIAQATTYESVAPAVTEKLARLLIPGVPDLASIHS